MNISMDDLYTDLQGLSKALEGSGRIDEHDIPGAYATILDAMAAVRAHSTAVEAVRADAIARLEQGGQTAAVSILRHHFEQKGNAT